MIKTENPGILEAIREVRIMGLSRTLRAVYEMKMKEIRDQKARDAYVRDVGITLGETRKLVSQVRKKLLQNQSAEEIADLLEEELSLIASICGLVKEHPEWSDGQICQELEGEDKKQRLLEDEYNY